MSKFVKVTSFIETNNIHAHLSTVCHPSKLRDALSVYTTFKELFKHDYTTYVPVESLTVGKGIYEYRTYTKRMFCKEVLVKTDQMHLYRLIRDGFTDMYLLELPEELKQLIGDTNES